MKRQTSLKLYTIRHDIRKKRTKKGEPMTCKELWATKVTKSRASEACKIKK